LFREQLSHANIDRRAQAIRGLADLGLDATDLKTLHGLINEREPYDVIIAAVQALGKWQLVASRDAFHKAKKVAGQSVAVCLAVYDALAKADAEEGKANSASDPRINKKMLAFLSDVGNGVKDSPLMTASLSEFLIPVFVRGTAKALKDMKSFTFLAAEEVDIQLRGAQIRSIYYYKMVTGQTVYYYIFRLTPEGKVGDIDIYPG
jgi:hypothetical protein